MPHLRTIIGLCGLLLAVAAWGCSSSDDADQPAAAPLASSDFQVASPNFSNIRPRVRIPDKHTCHGEDLSPPLAWSGAPAGTKSLALVAEDVDHETGVWVHWVLFNIPADVKELVEAIPTSTDALLDGTTQGTNDNKNIGYNGPCHPIKSRHYSYRPLPFEENPPHRYYFRLYALDTTLGLAPGATKAELVSAMEGHVLAETETLGKNSPPLTLSTKGGSGLLETSANTPTPTGR